MRDVSIVGIGQVPVQKAYEQSLQQLGATAVKRAMADAGIETIDALYAGNMLSDELQNQKHMAALIADEAGLFGIEALQVRAATASGAAALRMAYLAVASGEVDVAVAVGVEKMSEGSVTPALAKALHAKQEVAVGATLISKNAELMRLYAERYHMPEDGLVNFAINAHQNALTNPNALFQKAVTAVDVLNSRLIVSPIRLLDCSPICDGAAAVVLAARSQAQAYSQHPVHILASTVAVDRFRIDQRLDPLQLEAAQISSQKALQKAGIPLSDVSFFEVHDAFSIMACLLLEANGFAKAGQGWQLAKEGEIGRNGRVPIATMGGLKARGHPIGATAVYQVCEIVLQLSGRAGKNQIQDAKVALMQSVGGAGTTVLTFAYGT